MKAKLRTIFAFFLCVLLMLPTAWAQEDAPLQATTEESNLPTLTAEGEKALIYNLEYDRILWSEGENDSIAPASYVKIMTAALGFEHLAQTGDYECTVSEYTVKKTTGTNVGLKAGEILPFSELLYALVVGSANDAALAIAEEVSGSEAEFIAKMNQKAKELGMEHSYFANPTGMDQSAMYSTLADLVKLCAYAYQINDFTVMTNVVDHTIPATNLSKARKLHTKNLLIDPNPYTGYHTETASGLNAGSTTKAGFCVATATEHNGLTFLILIAQGKYQNDVYSSFTDASVLVAHARNQYRLVTVMKKDHAITEMKVELGKGTDNVMLVSQGEISALLPVDYRLEDLEYRYQYDQESLTAPVAKDSLVGTVEAFYQGISLGSTAIVTQRAIELSSLDSFWVSVGEFLQLPAVTTVLQIAIALLAILVTVLSVLLILRRRRNSAAERKAIRDYLKEDKLRFREDRKIYRENRIQKRKARQALFRRLRRERLKKKHEQYQAVMNKTRPATPPKKQAPTDLPPASPPSSQRRGDEYYRK